ncbi:hypothetical protein DEIPH_ctg011orf0003 [Deinococcus phoenicis]|uniref:Uncharacterized protein n=1 Tax=Deinococcus phoenicis TaxID=1476583 RepID=A0A016QSI9_9DEIO|nr:hypothetical protein DEIPH_ctg011orf0003 [Deinococcus phoenicis]
MQAQPGMTGSPVVVEYERSYMVAAQAAGGQFEGQVGAVTGGFASLLNKAGNGPLMVYGGEIGDPVPPLVRVRIVPRGPGVRGVPWDAAVGHPRDTGGGKWDGSALGASGAVLATEAQITNLLTATAQAQTNAQDAYAAAQDAYAGAQDAYAAMGAANDAASYAGTQGDYAQAQGDYAKAQAQRAESLANTAKGEPGPASTLSIGTVTTGAAGSAASASLTGAAPNQTLNLTLPAGPAGLTWRGAWAAATTYAVNDAVTYSGSSYRRKVAGKTATAPSGDSTNWEVIAQQGAAGTGGLDPAVNSLQVGGSGAYRAGYDAPGQGEAAALSVKGGIVVKGEATEHHFVANFPLNNVVSVQNLADDAPSAVRFLDKNGLERAAIGYQNPTAGGTALWDDMAYWEASRFIDRTNVRDQSKPLQGMMIVQTGNYGGNFWSYARQEFFPNLDIAFYDSKSGSNRGNINLLLRASGGAEWRELAADPTKPPAGRVVTYARSGKFWAMDSAGNIYQLGATTGGGSVVFVRAYSSAYRATSPGKAIVNFDTITDGAATFNGTVFTVPSTGIYDLRSSLVCVNLTDGDVLNASFFVNNVEAGKVGEHVAKINATGVSATLIGGTIIRLNTGDKVDVRLETTNVSRQLYGGTAQITTFTAFKLA